VLRWWRPVLGEIHSSLKNNQVHTRPRHGSPLVKKFWRPFDYEVVQE
jgi:hypothetical protein